MKTCYIYLAEGFEEIEALATVDILRRAGLDVKTVSIYTTPEVTGAHGIKVVADMTYQSGDYTDAAWMILPGGLPGATNLAAYEPLTIALQARNMRGGNIAAICASPGVVLAPLGIVKGKKATAYPGFEEALTPGGATAMADGVVADGNIVTGRGPGYTFEFALEIVRLTVGDKVAADVAAGMLLTEK